MIFASVLPVSDDHKDVDPSYERTPARPPVFIRALNDWLKSFCAQRGYVYLDYYPALVDGRANWARICPTTDCIRTPRATALMAPLLLAAVNKAVAPPPARLLRPRAAASSETQEG